MIGLHCNICHLYITISSGIILIISFDILLLEYSSILIISFDIFLLEYSSILLLLIILFGILLLEYSICPLSDCLPGYYLPGYQQLHVSPS